MLSIQPSFLIDKTLSFDIVLVMYKLKNNQCFVSKDTEFYQISDYDFDGAGRHRSHTHIPH